MPKKNIDYDNLFIKYLELTDNSNKKLTVKEICSSLNISERVYYTLTQRKHVEYETKSKYHQVYTEQNIVYIIVNRRQFILQNVKSDRKFLKYYIEQDKEYLTDSNGILFENKIIANLISLDEEKPEGTIMLTFNGYTKNIFYYKMKVVKKGTIVKTLYSGERLDVFKYKEKFYRIRKIVAKTRNYELNKPKYKIVNEGFNQKNFEKGQMMDEELFRIVVFGNKAFKTIQSLEYLIFYDCETFVDTDNCQLFCYMISIIILDDDGDIIYENVLKCDNYNMLLKNKEYIAELFTAEILKLIKYIKNDYKSSYDSLTDESCVDTPFLRIVGFNNTKFDDNFILEEFEKRGFIINAKQRNQKLSVKNFVFGDDQSKDSVYGNFIDMRNWLPDCSLKEACKDYNIETAKLEFDIVAYNYYCRDNNKIIKEIDKEMIKNFIKNFNNDIDEKFINNGKFQIYDYVTYYCLVDTKALIELHRIIKKTMHDIATELIQSLDMDFKQAQFRSNYLNFVSPAQYTSTLFAIYARKEKNKKLKVKNNEMNRFILKSFFGGRVNYGAIGEYHTKKTFGYYDITSQYPLCMTALYPIVNEPEDFEFGDEIDLQKYQKIINDITSKRIEYDSIIKDDLDSYDYTMFKPFDQEFRGIFLCDVIMPEIPEKMIGFAPMGYRKDETGLKYKNQNATDVVINTSYMKNYILSHYKIILKPSPYNIVFTKLGPIFKTYIEKLNTMKTEAKGVQKSKAKLLKLLSNSIAGKLAQRSDNKYTAYSGYSNNRKIVQMDTEDYNSSVHYLATFIFAEANYTIFSTMHRLSRHFTQNNVPFDLRCGAILYMDTDSLMYDASLCAKINFDESEEIKSFNLITNYYDITWKTKKKVTKCDKMFIISKKSYAYVNGDEIKLIKLKGEPNKDDYTVDDLRNLTLDIPKTTNKMGLVKSSRIVNTTYDSTTNRDYIKNIYEKNIKKTITIEKDYISIECKNEKVNELNKNNSLNFVIY